jgi:hypothetical protein
MIELTREQILDTLQHGWGTYVERFQRLSSKEQAAFLNKAGLRPFCRPACSCYRLVGRG